MCFREFGDRVLHWTTINEANNFPIFMCDEDSKYLPCASSNASYISAHNLLLAHASAVRLYRTKYQVCIFFVCFVVGDWEAVKLVDRDIDSICGALNTQLLFLTHKTICSYVCYMQGKQHGYIGLNLYTANYVPETYAEEDLLATQRAKDFLIGW